MSNRFERPVKVGCVLFLTFLISSCGGGGGSSGSAGQTLESSDFNTAMSFDVVRETGPRIATPEPEAEFTDADFEAGLPASRTVVPPDVDTTINRAPFFENLQNVDAIAGELIEILYRPQDLDGDVPGMFPEKLPQGADFDDNFDGSKTFRWQPLQEDVGITQFTVTAVDTQASDFRVSQPLLIRVSLPDDPSNIPNVAPTLDELKAHTARVNDPVVFELKGIDLNGTIPTLEVPNLPLGGTFNQHPRFDEVYVLRFIPAVAGQVNIDVIARDSVDPGLFTTNTVSLTVLESSAFEREGQPLRELAANRNIGFGFAALQGFYHRPDGAIYEATAAKEFSIVTPENSMKMNTINPLPGEYQFAATDNLVSFAKANDINVHGHPLVWHRQLPDWVLNSAPTERESIMLNHIDQLMNRYASDVSVWDVVNEPLDANGELRDEDTDFDLGSVWFQGIGESYIEKALRRARERAPEARLLINEFDISFAGPKFDGLLRLIDGLQARGVPLDGIGFQMHVFSSYDQTDELAINFRAIAERNLDIYITELDVALENGATFERQATVYEAVVNTCLQQSRCRTIQTWGFTDQYSFRFNDEPLFFDRSYQPKPAYTAMQQALGGGS